MCGINGIVDLSLDRHSQISEKLFLMNQDIRHRGPDASKIFEDGCVGLGHVRLSILDVSSSADQPMPSFSGRYNIVFNGEIYNFKELAEILRKQFSITLKTSGDTEVLVNLIECLGIDKALELIEGMFSFALYDKQFKRIYLCRDRFGEKPLFWFCKENKLYFSSELGPLTKQLKKSLTINYESLGFFLKKSYVPSGQSIYNEVKKLHPATYLQIDFSSGAFKIQENKYWDYLNIALNNSLNSQTSFDNFDYDEIKSQLASLLEEKINLTMVSDVPLGAFLSGGYDSSCVVAFMQKNSVKKIKTFSIGFNDKTYNEADHAKEISNVLGTDHHELYLSKDDLLKTISSLPQIYSEPFADSSQIPTLLLSELTKSKVTVSLSGDGGDEIFGGYSKYFLGQRIKETIGMAPNSLRRLIKHSKVLPIMRPAAKFFLNNAVTNFDQKFLKLNDIIDFTSDENLFLRLSLFNNQFLNVDSKINLDSKLWNSKNSFFRKSMICDALDYLPGDILTKVDMAGMSVSLETRIPLLNHHIAEFASKIPEKYLMNRGAGKFILKDIVHDYIPEQTMNRPKKGFDIPLGQYLRNELRDHTESNFAYGKKNFKEEMNFAEIDRAWTNHLENNSNDASLLWNLSTFFAWHEQNS
jgi:asparagine synthase (glutamine-hydrolysing)